MNDVPFDRVHELVDELSELDERGRAARLDDACGDDPALRAEVEALLAHMDQPPAFLDRSVAPIPASGLFDAAEPASVPKSIGRYRIRQRLGAGGMGTVYEAEQDHPRRIVALKTIRRALLTDALLRRFRVEAEVLGRLQHPGIALILEAGTFDAGDGTQPFFAMEFIQGLPITNYADEQNLDTKARVALIALVCDAVHHAHQKGVVHRDLKPDNILVQSDGQPKILDFGVARATDADVQVTTIRTEVGQLVGTIPYMSPEQVEGRPGKLDTRSDVYALGVLLYEVLSQRLPHDLTGRTIPEAARMIREDEPSRLGSVDLRLRGDLEVITMKALEKDVARRYQSADALAADLRRYLADKPVSARPPSTFYQLTKFARRNKGLVGGVIATLLVSVVGGLVAAYLAIQSSRNASEAKRKERAAVASESRTHLIAAAAKIDDAPLSARVHLEAVAPEHRNWEWRYLSASLEPNLRPTVSGPSFDATRAHLVFPEGGKPVLAIAQGHDVKLIDLRDDASLAAFRAPMPLRRAVLSPDGSACAATAETRDRLFVWDVASGALKWSTDAYAGIRRVSFSGDGSRLIFMCKSETVDVVILETDGGRRLIRHEGHPKCPGRIPALDHAGTRYIETLSFKGSRPHSRVMTATPEPTRIGWFPNTNAPGISPDGRRFVVSNYHELRVGTRGQWTKLRGHRDKPRLSAFSPDGLRLASADRSEVRMWDLRRSRCDHVFAARATQLCISPDNSLLGAITPEGPRLWRLGSQRANVLEGHTNYVYAVAVSPDGTLIASGSYGYYRTHNHHTVRVWDALTGQLVASFPGHAVTALSFSRDGTRVTAWHWGRWRSLDLASGETTESAPVAGDVSRTERLSQALEGLFASMGPGGAWTGSKQNMDVALGADGVTLVRGGSSGFLVFDIRTGRERFGGPSLTSALTMPDLFPHQEDPVAVAISDDGRFIATGHVDGSVRLWDARTRTLVANTARNAASPVAGSEIHTIDFSPDTTRLVAGGRSHMIEVYEVPTLEKTAELRGHEDYVHQVAFSPDGTQLVSGSGDTTVRIWDSVPGWKRHRQARAAAARREKMRPMVMRLVKELGDPAQVAARLRGDRTLDPEDRAAASRVLLAECLRRKRE